MSVSEDFEGVSFFMSAMCMYRITAYALQDKKQELKLIECAEGCIDQSEYRLRHIAATEAVDQKQKELEELYLAICN